MTKISAEHRELFRQDIPLAVWEKAEELYSVGVRGYHDFNHALDVLSRVDHLVEKQVGFVNYPAARLAALYHDAVYVVGAKDNEAKSAVELIHACDGVVDRRIVAAAHDLVLDTAAHASSIDAFDNWDTMLFMDCDVLGFADNWDQFQVQQDKIAFEFTTIIDPVTYQKGRADFLAGMYKKGVFRSPYFRKRLEQDALFNIQRALKELGVEV